MSFSKPVIVIDNGSYCCKSGFSCDNHPVSIIRTVVGRPKNRVGFYGRTYYDVFIGEDAIARIKDYDIQSPVVRGKIVHWDNMERIWHHVFYRELKVAPEERSVVLAVAADTSIKDKVKCCEIFFENLNAPAISVQSQSITALYGSGYTTGLSVDLGYDSSDVNPIYEGGHIAYAHMETNLSGRGIAQYIKNSFKDRGVILGDNEHQIISDMKLKVLQITPTTCELSRRMNYTLPDGRIIEIGREMHCASELIFNPELILGRQTNIIPLHSAVIIATKKCDADLHNEMFSAVVATGGLAATPGLTKRLQFEMEIALDKPVNIVESSEMYCVSWLGASIFAGMKNNEKVWVTKRLFEEYGEKVVRNKFI